MRLSLTALILCSLAPYAAAHPVPKDTHDRTIVVRLQKGDKPNQVRVRVEYRLEVDETTVYLSDMKDFKDLVNPLDYRGRPLEYYAEFAKLYQDIYADRLVVRVNKKEIPDFKCLSHKERLIDEDGKPLGHLRCDFVFESAFELDEKAETKFRLREQNYLFDAGQTVLSVVNESSYKVLSQIVPDDALRKRAKEKPEPDDDFKVREVTVIFAPAASHDAATPTMVEEKKSPHEAQPVPEARTHDETFSLLRLILHTDYGLTVILLLAFAFGAAHALTPGHGKTLVAAYLVGERGTIWHALFLGVITTLTHTGSILLIAVILALLPNHLQQAFMAWIVNGLGLIMGLLVTCMGFWLFLQRLSGRADHVHIGGGHHHHHHHESAPPSTDDRQLSWWGLVVLGITGGLVPCVDAIVLLIYTVGTSQFWLVLPAILAFSAGLALVLVLIGILVVQVPRFVESRYGNGRLLKALPIVSAVVVTLMGIWLCYEGVHGQ